VPKVKAYWSRDAPTGLREVYGFSSLEGLQNAGVWRDTKKISKT
jgi:hypothetical protein